MKNKVMIFLLTMLLPLSLFSAIGTIIQLNSDKSIMAKMNYDGKIQIGGRLKVVRTGLLFNVADIFAPGIGNKVIVRADSLDTENFDSVNVGDSVVYEVHKAGESSAVVRNNAFYNKGRLRIAIIPLVNKSIGGAGNEYSFLFKRFLYKFLGKYRSLDLLSEKAVKKNTEIYNDGVYPREMRDIERVFRNKNLTHIITGSYKVMGGKIYMTLDLIDFAKAQVIDTGLQKEIRPVAEKELVSLLKIIETNLSKSLNLNRRDMKLYSRPEIPSIKREAIIDYYKALQYKEEGKIAEEEYALREALKVDPSLADAYKDIGYIYQKKGFYDEAEQLYKMAISKDHSFAEAYFNLGIIYYMRGWYYEAIKQYNKAYEENKNMKEVYFNRALAYQKTGQIKNAKKDFEKYLTYDNSSELAKYARTQAAKTGGE